MPKEFPDKSKVSNVGVNNQNKESIHIKILDVNTHVDLNAQFFAYNNGIFKLHC